MLIYDELKKRELIENEKEFNEMIWLKQVYVNGTHLESAKVLFNRKDVDTIQIGFTEFSLND